jgi:hypothetical protein
MYLCDTGQLCSCTAGTGCQAIPAGVGGIAPEQRRNEHILEHGGKPAYAECGGCGHIHPLAFGGDCRDDGNRFTDDMLDEIYGLGGWDLFEFVDDHLIQVRP